MWSAPEQGEPIRAASGDQKAGPWCLICSLSELRRTNRTQKNKLTASELEFGLGKG